MVKLASRSFFFFPFLCAQVATVAVDSPFFCVCDVNSRLRQSDREPGTLVERGLIHSYLDPGSPRLPALGACAAPRPSPAAPGAPPAAGA